MEGIGAILVLILLALTIAPLVFVIWVMYTIAKSLKEISMQLARMNSILASK